MEQVQDSIQIQVQPTPNPYAFKFIVDRPVKVDGKATFANRDEAEGIPLVESLFMITGVRQVHLFQNTITVTHVGDLDDESLQRQTETVLLTRLPIHNPNFEIKAEANRNRPPVDRSNLSPDLQKIEEILDRTIRPGLQADGGDIEVLRFENNEVVVLYQGACGGCPSSLMGTLDAIQSILQHEMDNPHLVVSPV